MDMSKYNKIQNEFSFSAPHRSYNFCTIFTFSHTPQSHRFVLHRDEKLFNNTEEFLLKIWQKKDCGRCFHIKNLFGNYLDDDIIFLNKYVFNVCSDQVIISTFYVVSDEN